ncbi:MAG: ribosome silencing factor [Xanthomonadales bacterium]|nr:ribosome silencing factor [Xanthomonadales bacterium]
MSKATKAVEPQFDPTDPESLVELVQSALEDAKAVDITAIDVRDKTSITDYMIVASGNSTRHVKTLSDAVVERSKESGASVLGVEGEREAEWMLVDLADVLVHLMLPRTRAFYALEKLWSVEPATAES